MIATFMPWIKMGSILGTFEGTTIDGTKGGDGWITFGLFAITLLISLIKDKTKSLKGGLLYVAIIPSIIAAAIGIWEIIDLNSSMSQEITRMTMAMSGSSASIGFGLYLLVLAGISIPIIAFVLKNKQE